MKKVYISFLHNLHHVEFKTFYSSLLRLMQEQEFADSSLTDLLERLQSQKDDVENLRRKVPKSDKTPIIGNLSRLRTDYLISLRLEVKAKKLSYIPEMRQAAKRLHTWLKLYKKEPYIQSVSTQDIVVESILGCIRDDESLRGDIALLQLDGLIDAIDRTTRQIAKQVNKRSEEKTSKQKRGRDIRDAAYQEVKILANYLEYKVSLIQDNVAESEHYMLMIEMHQRLKDIRKAFRIRTAKDKTRKEKEAVKQLKATQPTDINQPEIIEENNQTKPTAIMLTETQNQPSPIESLPEVAIEAPPSTMAEKQRIKTTKPKMSKR